MSVPLQVSELNECLDLGVLTEVTGMDKHSNTGGGQQLGVNTGQVS